MQYNVFISYSTKDLEKVNTVKRILERTKDIDVFVAEYSVKPGEKLSGRIKKRIRASNMVILLWSKNSQSSDWVSQEIGIAQEGDKLIIPVLLDKDLTPPGFISDIKYLDAHDNFENAVKELQDEVMRRVEKFQKVSSIIIAGLTGAFLYLLFSEDEDE